MKILSDFDIEVSAEEVLRSLYMGRKADERMLDNMENALEIARKLWHPTIIYDWLECTGVDGEYLGLKSHNSEEETRLYVGPHADLMNHAESALLSVNSVMGEIDEKVHQLNQEGESLLAYFVDSVGVVALGKVGDAARHMAEEEAQRRGWGVGANLSPGSLVGWPVEEQRNLCALLPLEKAGLHLNSSGIIIPFKSASSLIGMGRGYRAKKVGSVCKFCMHKETCWRRRPDVSEDKEA